MKEMKNLTFRRKCGCRGLAAVLVSAWLCAPAEGFYFVGWPGAGVPEQPNIIPPNTDKPSNPPSGNNPPDTPEHPPTPPIPEVPNENPPEVPEPGTATAALIGLAGLAIWNRRRRVVSESIA